MQTHTLILDVINRFDTHIMNYITFVLYLILFLFLLLLENQK